MAENNWIRVGVEIDRKACQSITYNVFEAYLPGNIRAEVFRNGLWLKGNMSGDFYVALKSYASLSLSEFTIKAERIGKDTIWVIYDRTRIYIFMGGRRYYGHKNRKEGFTKKAKKAFMRKIKYYYDGKINESRLWELSRGNNYPDEIR